MVLLCRANERVHARRIDVIGDLVLHDSHVVAIALPHARHAAFHGVDLLHGAHDFIITWRIKRKRRAAGCDRSEDRHALVALMLPVLVFLLVLEVRADRNWNR
jgi:hypothetical protein